MTADGRPPAGHGGADARGGPASGPSTHVGWTCGLTVTDDRPTVTRRQVTVTDHGTGTGASVATLTVTGSEADRLAPAGPGTILLPPLVLHLRPTTEDPQVVEIEDPGRSAGGRVAHVAHRFVADHLLARFTHARLDPEAPDPTVHAGAVAVPGGPAALLLGPSGTGKSTLVAHLVHRGLELLNDEQVSMHPGPEVVGGFTRPISIKPGGADRLPAEPGRPLDDGDHGTLVTAARLGGVHRLQASPTLLVVLDRTATLAERGPEELSAGQAVEALCENNLDLAAKPARGLVAFAWLASVTRAVRLPSADTEGAVEAILALLAEPTRPPTGFRVAPSPVGTGPGPVPGPDVVAVEVGDELVAYHGGSRAVVRLNAAGAQAWRSLPHRSDDPAESQLLEDLHRLGFLG